VVIISPDGHTRKLPTGYPMIADLIWEPQAPAIAVQPTRGAETRHHDRQDQPGIGIGQVSWLS
jgi:hypothetical protein